MMTWDLGTALPAISTPHHDPYHSAKVSWKHRSVNYELSFLDESINSKIHMYGMALVFHISDIFNEQLYQDMTEFVLESSSLIYLMPSLSALNLPKILSKIYRTDVVQQLILMFLHDQPWISPWIKSMSNDLDIIIHVIASQLFCHCVVISNWLWRHRQNENWACVTHRRCVQDRRFYRHLWIRYVVSEIK